MRAQRQLCSLLEHEAGRGKAGDAQPWYGHFTRLTDEPAGGIKR
jgi:hypothetical protein